MTTMHIHAFDRLRGRLLLLIFLALLPAVLFIVYSSAEQRQLVLDEVRDDSEREARIAAGMLEQQVEGARQLLIATVENLADYDADPVTYQRHLCAIMEQFPQYSNLGIVGLDGTLRHAAVMPNLLDHAEALTFKDRPWFKQSLKKQGFSVGGYLLGRIRGKNTLIFTYSVPGGNGSVRAVAFATLDLGWLNREIGASARQSGSAFLIVDDRGHILVHKPDPQRWVGTAHPDSEMVRTMLARKSGTAELACLDGVRRFATFMPVRGSGERLFVSAGMPLQDVMAQITAAQYHKLAILGVAALVVVAIGWFGADWFVLRQVHALNDAANQLAAGDFAARTGLARFRGEIGDLARTFDRMVEHLRQRDMARLEAERELRESERRFRDILEKIHLVGVGLNPDGTVAFCNDALLQLTGWSRDDVIGCSWFDRFVPPGQGMVRRVFETTIVEGAIPVHFENDILTRDGRRRYISWSNTVLRDATGAVTGTASIGEDITDRKEMENRIYAYQEQLKALAVELSLVEERERRRIATELHDQLGQNLAFTKIRLGALKGAHDDPAQRRQFDEIGDLLDQAIQDIRSLTFQLSPPLLYEVGLEAALAWLAERFGQDHGWQVRFHAGPEPVPLGDEMKVALFQVVREVLANVAKHARAGSVDATISRDTHGLVISIEDDGVGFDAGVVSTRGGGRTGFGLFSIRQRIEHLGGALDIDSVPGGGARVMITVPLTTETKEQERVGA